MSWPQEAQAIIDFATEKGIRGAANRSAGQVTSGTHASGSEHYQGRAVDFGGADSDAGAVEALFAPMAATPGSPVDELYGYNGASFKNGAVLSPEPAGHKGNHTHVGVRQGTTLDALRSGKAGPATGTATVAVDPKAGFLSGLTGPGGGKGWATRVAYVVGGAAMLWWGFVLTRRAMVGS